MTHCLNSFFFQWVHVFIDKKKRKQKKVSFLFTPMFFLKIFCQQDYNNKWIVYCHTFQSKRFVLCADVCPTILFGYTPPPEGYMFVIGVIETLCSILLMLPLTNLHARIYLVFAVLMALAIYTHGVLAQFGKMVVPMCLFLACLVLYKMEPLTLSNMPIK